jgi:hypothetical protein
MTAPNQPPPSGNFIYAYGLDPSGDQSVSHQQTDWTTQTIQSALGAAGGITGSWTNAQNTHAQIVSQPLLDNANQIGQSATTLTNHENRIHRLEDGSQIAVYYSNDTWHKPSGFTYHHVHCIGGSGGGQGGQDAGPFQSATGTCYGGQGGGQGGYQITDFADADLPLSSYSISIGTGGFGAYAYLSDNFQRADNTALGAYWRNDSGDSGYQAAIMSNRAEAGVVPSPGFVSSNRIITFLSTYTAAELLTDNYVVTAQVTTPVRGEATNLGSFTGVYIAAPSTYGSSTKWVGFAASATRGSAMITQTGTPDLQSDGQTSVATSTTNIADGQTIALRRSGNVFTGFINGNQVCQWTDTGNTVSSGAGYRHFGILLQGVTSEDSHGVVAAQLDSPAISQIIASDLDATAGTATTFSGGAVTVTGGGGSAGSVFGASGPAAAGSGNQTTLNAGGGTGGSSASVPGQAGGNGAGSTGGAGGVNPGDPGHDGANLPTGSYGPGAGGGGGAGSTSTSAEGGKGGNGGFPGGGGAGGGGTPAKTKNPGGGGNGNAGYCVVISNNSAT